ncbi:hypothetical protein [Pseudoduganella sp. OTU4001]
MSLALVLTLAAGPALGRFDEKLVGDAVRATSRLGIRRSNRKVQVA